MPKIKNWDTLHHRLIEDLKTLSLSKTAKKHNLNVSTLWNYCKRKNIPIETKHYQTFDWDKIHDVIIRDLQTLSLIEVSEKHDLPYTTLWKYCSRNKINAPVRKFRKKSAIYIDWPKIHDDLVKDLKITPLYQVAKKHKLTYSSLAYYCNKNELYFFKKTKRPKQEQAALTNSDGD